MNNSHSLISLADVARSLGRSAFTVERAILRAGITPVEVRCAGRTIVALSAGDVARLREMPGLVIAVPQFGDASPSGLVAAQ